jgi:hypothetical protein
MFEKSRMVAFFVRFEIRKNENYYADKNYGGCYYLDFKGDRKNQDNSQHDNKKGNKKYNTNVFHKEKCKNKTAMSQ